jgi:hypothetical protein
MGAIPSHIQAATGQELPGTHLIEEDERADHLAFSGGQGASHLEPADVVRTGHDYLSDAHAAASR